MVSRDKETLAEENRQLKQLLAQHGIPWNGTGGVDELARNASIGYTSSGSISGSYAPGSQSYSPPPPQLSNSNPSFLGASPSDHGMNGRSIAQQQIQQGVDYDQAGIDFVLTYGDSEGYAPLRETIAERMRTRGVLANECAERLRAFFGSLRAQGKK